MTQTDAVTELTWGMCVPWGAGAYHADIRIKAVIQRNLPEVI